MKLLFDTIQFENAKCKEKLQCECLNCKNTFLLGKNTIKAILKGKTHMTGNFCSNKCQRKFQTPRKIVFCEQCNMKFEKRIGQIKQTKHNFCCQSCAAKYNNAHKTKGTRISKLEKWIQEQLQVLYPTQDFFHFNRKDAINSELDIYIPSIKLAFELNGIFHYEPIYGQDKLNSIKNNDERKIQACIENRIEFCIIDISNVVNFKIEKAKKFLDIIINIINLKLSKIN